MKKFIVFLLLFIITLFTPFIVNAATGTEYSNVLDDLKQDTSFNPNDYPYIPLAEVESLNGDIDENNDINLMQVIQIAETKDKQLLIYVYQPSRNDSFYLNGTSINISTTINENASYSKYELTLLSTNGQFEKYLVNDFVVSDNAIRYYEISEINRSYNSLVDKENNTYYKGDDIVQEEGLGGTGGSSSNTGNGGNDENNDYENGVLINEYAHTVAQQWTATTYSNGVKYEMTTIDVIVFTNQYAGTIRYPNGFYLISYSKVDSHFMAFNTDRKIDDLLEVELEYNLNHYYYLWTSASYNITEYTNTTKVKDVINCDEFGEVDKTLFRPKRTWQRIQKTSDFISKCEENKVDLEDDTITELNKCAWVVSFKETEYTNTNIAQNDTLGIVGRTEKSKYYVSEIDVLRLKFITDGVVYNLGVVANTISPDDIIDGTGSSIDIDLSSLEEWFQKIMMLVGIVILLLAVSFVAPVCNIITKIFSLIINAVYFVITLPFNLIKKLFKPRKN